MPEVSRRTIAVSLVFLGYQFGIFPADEKKKAKFFAFLHISHATKNSDYRRCFFPAGKARPARIKKRVVMTGEAVLLL
jgi:hypothetical protein